MIVIPPQRIWGGGVYWIHPVRPSVRPSAVGVRMINRILFIEFYFFRYMCHLGQDLGQDRTFWCTFDYNSLHGQSRFPRILNRNGQNGFRGKVNDPNFQYQQRVSQDARVVQTWWFQPKAVTRYHPDKPNFLEFLVKMAKITLKVKVNETHFQ